MVITIFTNIPTRAAPLLSVRPTSVRHRNEYMVEKRSHTCVHRYDLKKEWIKEIWK